MNKLFALAIFTLTTAAYAADPRPSYLRKCYPGDPDPTCPNPERDLAKYRAKAAAQAKPVVTMPALTASPNGPALASKSAGLKSSCVMVPGDDGETHMSGNCAGRTPPTAHPAPKPVAVKPPVTTPVKINSISKSPAPASTKVTPDSMPLRGPTPQTQPVRTTFPRPSTPSAPMARTQDFFGPATNAPVAHGTAAFAKARQEYAAPALSLEDACVENLDVLYKHLCQDLSKFTPDATPGPGRPDLRDLLSESSLDMLDRIRTYTGGTGLRARLMKFNDGDKSTRYDRCSSEELQNYMYATGRVVRVQKVAADACTAHQRDAGFLTTTLERELDNLQHALAEARDTREIQASRTVRAMLDNALTYVGKLRANNATRQLIVEQRQVVKPTRLLKKLFR
jgi:hypothetical protein